jgi:hypothetical protein
VVGPRVGRRRVVRHLRRCLDVSAKTRHHAGEDHHEAVRAGIDDTGLAEHLELLGGASHGLLAVADGVLEQLGEQRVLLGRARVG